MKKLIPVLVILCSSLLIPSCKKDSPIPVVKTLTIYPTKDAAIFNGTNFYNSELGTNGQYNDYGSGGSDLLRVGYADRNYFLMRSLVAFDVSSIPANVKILSATLAFTIARTGNKSPAVYVHKLTQDWTEGTTREASTDRCTWSDSFCSSPGVQLTGGDVSYSHANFNATPWTTAGGSYVSTPSDSVSNGGTPVFSSDGLVADVKAWMVTPTSNYGWILKVNETGLTGTGGEQIRYLSREAAANGAPADTKPRLVITYQQ